MFIFLDGEIAEKKNLKIDFLDNCGIFETLRSYNRKIFKFEEHLKRLFNSARSLNIPLSFSYRELKKIVLKSFLQTKLNNAYIRVSLSYPVSSFSKSLLLIFIREIPAYPEEMYEKGVDVKTSSFRKNFSAISSSLKSSDFSCSILSKIESQNMGSFEAIQLNYSGYVCEGTVSNIFVVKKNILFTPPVSCNILEGITRNTVIEIARKNKLELDEKFLTLYDIYNAEEVFLTNTVLEIMPVRSVDNRLISEKTGKITKFLIEEFRKIVR